MGERVAATLTALHLESGTAQGPVATMPSSVAPAAAAAAIRGAWPGGAASSPRALEPPLEGWTARVAFAAAGSAVVGRIVDVSWKTKTVTLASDDVATASAGARAAPPACRHFGTCGGCLFQSTTYDEQARAKERHLDAVFEGAFGAAAWRALRPALARYATPPPREYRYRNRVSLSMGEGRDEWRLRSHRPHGSSSHDGEPPPALAAAGGGERPVVLGFHPSRHVTGAAGGGGGGGAWRRRAQAAPDDAAAASAGGGGTAVPPATHPSGCCPAASAAPPPSPPPPPAHRGLWSKIVHIDDCALMAPGAASVLGAVRDAAAAWGADALSAALPSLPACIEEVTVRTGAAPVARDGRVLPAPASPVMQLVLRWSDALHVEAFRRPFVERFLLPRVRALPHVASVVGLAFPTSVPRALRKQWVRDELQLAAAGGGASSGSGAPDAAAANEAAAAAARRRALAYLAGTSVVYDGCERLLTRYQLPSGAALDLHVSPRSFIQPSDKGAEAILAALTHAARHAQQLSPPAACQHVVAWDLFCGTGSLGLALVVQGLVHQLVGLELDDPAVDDARGNARVNGVEASRASFVAANLEEAQPLRSLPRPQWVIVDPPRAGLHRRLLAQLACDGPEFIFYVSCNPTSQARDVSALCGAGAADAGLRGSSDGGARYQLRSMTPVDQYAHTVHLESVVLLQRVR